MLDHEAIENYLVHSGYTEPSLIAMRLKYDRIIRRMHKRGYDDLSSDAAITELTQIVLEMRLSEMRRGHGATVEHSLRNITGVRKRGKWKP